MEEGKGGPVDGFGSGMYENPKEGEDRVNKWGDWSRRGVARGVGKHSETRKKRMGGWRKVKWVGILLKKEGPVARLTRMAE